MSVLATNFYLLFTLVPRFAANHFGLPGKLILQTRTTSLPPEPRLCSLGNTKFDDRLRWDLDFLLRLGIKARAPLLLHKFAKIGRDKLASLFNLFVSELAKSVQQYSRGSFLGLCGFGKGALNPLKTVSTVKEASNRKHTHLRPSQRTRGVFE
jgi:hypothetical protein